MNDQTEICRITRLASIGKVAAAVSVFIGIVMLTPSPVAAQDKRAHLPDGPGKEVTQRICSTCHGVEIVMGRGLTRDGWTAVVTDMIDRGAQGTDDEFGQIVEYLAKNFPPKSDGEKKSSSAAKK